MTQLDIVDNRTLDVGLVVAGQVRESSEGLVVLVVDGRERMFNAVILVDTVASHASESLEYKLNHCDDVDSASIRRHYPKILNGSMTIK